MRKYQKIVLFLGLWALLGLLGGLFSVLMAGKIAVLPDAKNDRLFAYVGPELPTSWQQPVDWQLCAQHPEVRAVCGPLGVEPAPGAGAWSLFAESFSRQNGLVTSWQAYGLQPLRAQEQGLLPMLILPALSEAEKLPPLQLFWQREPQQLTLTLYDYSWWHSYGRGTDNFARAPKQELKPAADGSYTLPHDGKSYVVAIDAEWRTGENGLGGKAQLCFFLPGELT